MSNTKQIANIQTQHILISVSSTNIKSNFKLLMMAKKNQAKLVLMILVTIKLILIVCRLKLLIQNISKDTISKNLAQNNPNGFHEQQMAVPTARENALIASICSWRTFRVRPKKCRCKKNSNKNKIICQCEFKPRVKGI